MAFEYVSSMLEEAVQTVNPVDIRGRVEQVIGTIIRAVVPGVKVGDECILVGSDGKLEIRIEEMGSVCSTLGNEITCGMPIRLPYKFIR